ncbi:MAG: molybdopterin molybdotransferase MoeA [Parvularculaceae bacterium]
MALLTLDEALSRVRVDAPPPPETVPIEAALGRVLEADEVSSRASPTAAVSAMDGYAVRTEDLGATREFDVVGEAPAGGAFGGAVGPGQTVRIFTGGVLPSGADRVIVQENAARRGDRVALAVDDGAAAHVRPAGLDFAAGETVARAGEALTPARLALVAAANVGRVQVRGRPRIVVLATGDELAPPGTDFAPGRDDARIVDSAAPGVAAAFAAWGGQARAAPVLRDERDAAAAALRSAAREADLIVVIGGASVGDRDVARPAAVSAGATIDFAGVALKPGKPVWFARIDGGPALLGLPGNPASALVCAHLFGPAAMRALLGRPALDLDRRLRPARLAAALPANGPREAFLRARLAWTADGEIAARTDDRQDSALLTPFADADALLRRRPDAPPAEEGALVDVLPLTGEDGPWPT